MLDEAIARIKQMEMYFDILKKSKEEELKKSPEYRRIFYSHVKLRLADKDVEDKCDKGQSKQHNKGGIVTASCLKNLI